jgi:hypothetical protein
LDLQALGELSQFQKMVAETAKTLWRAANPNRERLPSHFEERVRLCLRRIEDGSATAPLEVFIEENDQRTFWGPEPVEIKDAVKLAHEVFEAIGADAQLPERFPRALLPEYAKWVLIAFLSWLKFPDYFKQAKKFSIYFEQKEEVALLQLIYRGFLRHEQESLNN